MPDYEPKSQGVTYLRHAYNHRNKKLKYLTVPVERAKEIIDQAAGFNPASSGYNLKSNSLKGAAVVLAMEPKELMERLNCPVPSKILNDLAEARNRIKALEEAGDACALSAPKHLQQAWVKAKML